MTSFRIDRPETRLWLAVAGLVAVGLVTLWTSIPGPGDSPDRSYAVRQAIYVVIGLLGAVAIRRIPLDWFSDRWTVLWAAATASIAVVFLLGQVTRGSRRWIELGPVNVQPSEFAKVAVILVGAAYLGRRVRNVDEWTVIGTALAVIGIPGLLVFMQPDLGTAQVYAAIAVALLFFAGISWRILAGMLGIITFALVSVMWLLPAIGVEPLEPHQRDRLLAFADPESDPQGVSYHAIQSKIAIGSGGLMGRDSSETSQTAQQFLPEPHTDFVFATIVERFGFVGGAITIALLAWLMWQCLQAVSLAPTTEGRLVAGGILAYLATHVIVNVGMTMGLMPITGVPLPLVSYGGSSMLTTLAAIGLLAGILRSSEAARVRYARRAARLSNTDPVGRRSRRAARASARGAQAPPLVGGRR